MKQPEELLDVILSQTTTINELRGQIDELKKQVEEHKTAAEISSGLLEEAYNCHPQLMYGTETNIREGGYG